MHHACGRVAWSGMIARLLGIAVVMAAAALGTASPSSADQVMEGIYTFNTEGSPPAEWTIYPLCTPTVGDLRVPLELPVACKLKVVSATPSGAQYFDSHHGYRTGGRSGLVSIDAKCVDFVVSANRTPRHGAATGAAGVRHETGTSPAVAA